MTARLYIQWHVCLDERDPWLSYVIYHTTVWSRLASATTPSVALDLPPLDGHLDSSDRKPELDSNTHVEFVRLSLCYFCFAAFCSLQRFCMRYDRTLRVRLSVRRSTL